MEREYKQTPIIEALCEFQFDPTSPWDLTIPGLVYESIRDDFPQRRQASVLNVGVVQVAENQQPQPQFQFLSADRMQFVRDDDTALVQVGPHYLSVNHLKPYSSWDRLLPMTLKAFDAYCRNANPRSIQRIGLRYVNRIEITGDRIELGDYLAFYPFVGSKLPQDYRGFTVAVQVSQEEMRDGMNLQAASVPSGVIGLLTLILDIDYFLARPGAVSLDMVENWLEAAHRRVIATFEAAITDRLRAMFEEVSE